MKSKSLLYLLCLGIFLSCQTAQKAQTPAVTVAVQSQKQATPFVTWEQKLIDLGSVKKGEKRDMKFVFTNTSGEPIQIEILDACECTTTDFPRGIIPPGGKGEIPATFNSESKEESETIAINVYFKQNDENGNPRIERVEYKFELVK